MSTLTLDEALALVHPWLGTPWKPTRCPLGPHPGDPNRPPPATDALAMQVLRKLKEQGVAFSLDAAAPTDENWRFIIYPWVGGAFEEIVIGEPNLRDAIIIAAAMLLQRRETDHA